MLTLHVMEPDTTNELQAYKHILNYIEKLNLTGYWMSQEIWDQ